MKLKLGLVPGFFIRALAVPFMLGEAKYARGDWANQKDPEKFIQDRTDSMLRHMTEYQDGIEYDQEGPHHLAAVAWNALVILFYRHYRIGKNIDIYSRAQFEATLEKYKSPKPAPGTRNNYQYAKYPQSHSAASSSSPITYNP